MQLGIGFISAQFVSQSSFQFAILVQFQKFAEITFVFKAKQISKFRFTKSGFSLKSQFRVVASQFNLKWKCKIYFEDDYADY